MLIVKPEPLSYQDFVKPADNDVADLRDITILMRSVDDGRGGSHDAPVEAYVSEKKADDECAVRNATSPHHFYIGNVKLIT